LYVPAVTGVPEIVRVLGFTDRPIGSDPETTENRYGVVPPLTETTALYAVPTIPGGRLAETLMWPSKPWFAKSKLLNLLLALADERLALCAGRPQEVVIAV